MAYLDKWVEPQGNQMGLSLEPLLRSMIENGTGGGSGGDAGVFAVNAEKVTEGFYRITTPQNEIDAYIDQLNAEKAGSMPMVYIGDAVMQFDYVEIGPEIVTAKVELDNNMYVLSLSRNVDNSQLAVMGTRLPYYTLTSTHTSDFVQGVEYTFKVERVVSPAADVDIQIVATGGTLDAQSFKDSIEDFASVTFKFTPTAEKCTIQLLYGAAVVGQFVIEQALVVPAYTLTCAETQFEAEKEYEITVLRDTATVKQTQIEVSATGGDVSPAFIVDEGAGQPFENVKLIVTPLSVICTVQLTVRLGGKTYTVGQFEMTDVEGGEAPKEFYVTVEENGRTDKWTFDDHVTDEERRRFFKLLPFDIVMSPEYLANSISYFKGELPEDFTIPEEKFEDNPMIRFNGCLIWNPDNPNRPFIACDYTNRIRREKWYGFAYVNPYLGGYQATEAGIWHFKKQP